MASLELDADAQMLLNKIKRQYAADKEDTKLCVGRILQQHEQEQQQQQQSGKGNIGNSNKALQGSIAGPEGSSWERRVPGVQPFVSANPKRIIPFSNTPAQVRFYPHGQAGKSIGLNETRRFISNREQAKKGKFVMRAD